MKKIKKKSSFAFWKKIHIYCFGYFKWMSIFVSTLFVIISITGVLYNHQHDFEFLEKSRLSTQFLPDSYQERLDRTRKAQGLEDIFSDEAESVPLMWIIKDLHTGDIFGLWGRILYDLVGIVIIILAISGCYLFLIRKTHTNKKPKESRK